MVRLTRGSHRSDPSQETPSCRLTPCPPTPLPNPSEASPPQPGDALAGKLRRTEIQRAQSSIPGREIVQVLTEIPAGVESGWHTHPGEEVGYIVGGTVQMRIKDRPTLILPPGHGFLIPPGTPHNALDLGPETGWMLSTYIVAVGEPLAAFAHPDGPEEPAAG